MRGGGRGGLQCPARGTMGVPCWGQSSLDCEWPTSVGGALWQDGLERCVHATLARKGPRRPSPHMPRADVQLLPPLCTLLLPLRLTA